ncbi:MAG TPA: UDP-N-acetylmuramoyl-tripeptide--D-alanyl-D-alanine ligase [Myxococcota bacterium]|nr:UDP-N-acetylmuramoyl-tripeptide--D-alanyl-D-alanine ligase [Myxococcota bacterium]
MSEAFSAEEAVRWTGGELARGDGATRFAAVTIDSRNVPADSLFVAIAGARFDGHDFLEDALRAGAAGCAVRAGGELPKAARCAIAVEDTTRALGALAAGHRRRYDGPLVAITGSNGKTTTKEMCAAIFAVSGPCLKNEGNLNNEFGLPLTLLRRGAEHRSVVVELGMNHRGEIARLAAIARPRVGVITNAGTAHIEHLGSRANIALEKGDLVAALDGGGTAVLNADDPLVMEQAARTRARVLRFGLGELADVRADDVAATSDGRHRFALTAPQGRTQVSVAGLGETTVPNALAAAAAALASGVPLSDVAAGLRAYRPVAGRLSPIALAGGGLLIDDTYNANPQSMEVALRTLARGDAGGHRIAVLGDMGELGEYGAEAHSDAGALAAQLGIDRLFAVGAHAGEVVSAARAAGMDASALFAGREWEETAQRVLDALSPGDRVLVKGSRSMRMERIVAHLRRGAGAEGD